MTEQENSEIAQKNRFCYGLLLAWIPLILFFAPTAIAIFRELSSQKATGIAVVQAGFTEAAATFGLVAIVASEVVAVVLLARTFSRTHLTRTLVAIFSVGCSSFLLLVVGLFLWFVAAHR